MGKAEESNLLPPISGWDSDSTMECSREFLPAIEKWERRKEEERKRWEEKDRKRKRWEPLASEVDTAAIVGKKRDHRILDPLFFSGKIRKNRKNSEK